MDVSNPATDSTDVISAGLLTKQSRQVCSFTYNMEYNMYNMEYGIHIQSCMRHEMNHKPKPASIDL